jgi:hypothetical protein
MTLRKATIERLHFSAHLLVFYYGTQIHNQIYVSVSLFPLEFYSFCSQAKMAKCFFEVAVCFARAIIIEYGEERDLIIVLSTGWRTLKSGGVASGRNQ